MNAKPAIILAAHTMALGVVRALGWMGVPVAVVHYDKRDFAHRSKYVKDRFAAPHPEDDPKGFLERLCTLPKCWHGGVLFPVSDETLKFTSRHKVLLQEHFTVACPDYDTVCRIIEKRQTYPLVAAAGIPVPYTFMPRSSDELRAAADELLYPCLVKPSQSHLFYQRFGCKMFVADTREQLMKHYQRAVDAGLEVVVQEYIPGDDTTVFNYNSYSVNGQPLVEFTAQHIRNAPPHYGSPRVVQSLEIPELCEAGRRVMSAFNYTGYACTEFKRDQRDGRFKLMEVNGRHNLSTLLAVGCGINFPWLEYRHLAYDEIPVAHDFESGIYWIDLTRDIAYSLEYLPTERLKIEDYLRPYLGKKVWAIFASDDWQPFIHRLVNVASGRNKPSGVLQRQPRRDLVKGHGPVSGELQTVAAKPLPPANEKKSEGS